MPLPCPCESAKPYINCCKPLHEGQAAPSPEALMRARYSAFALELTDYLTNTHHPNHRRPYEMGDEVWVKLRIKKAYKNKVEFQAYFHEGDRLHCLHEESSFIQEDGQWYYLDGEHIDSKATWERNEACWCGRDTKFKKCHGKA